MNLKNLKNLKTFLSWHPGCFFCGDELATSFESFGLKADLVLENDYFICTTQFIRFKFHTETGAIVKDNEPWKEYAITDIHVRLKCLSCESKGMYYGRCCIYRANALTTRMYPSLMQEIIAYDDISFQQCLLTGDTKLEVYKLFDVAGADKDTSRIKKQAINLPYIDLTKIQPAKFKDKIRTYIVFS